MGLHRVPAGAAARLHGEAGQRDRERVEAHPCGVAGDDDTGRLEPGRPAEVEPRRDVRATCLAVVPEVQVGDDRAEVVHRELRRQERREGGRRRQPHGAAHAELQGCRRGRRGRRDDVEAQVQPRLAAASPAGSERIDRAGGERVHAGAGELREQRGRGGRQVRVQGHGAGRAPVEARIETPGPEIARDREGPQVEYRPVEPSGEQALRRRPGQRQTAGERQRGGFGQLSRRAEVKRREVEDERVRPDLAGEPPDDAERVPGPRPQRRREPRRPRAAQFERGGQAVHAHHLIGSGRDREAPQREPLDRDRRQRRQRTGAEQRRPAGPVGWRLIALGRTCGGQPAPDRRHVGRDAGGDEPAHGEVAVQEVRDVEREPQRVGAGQRVRTVHPDEPVELQASEARPHGALARQVAGERAIDEVQAGA